MHPRDTGLGFGFQVLDVHICWSRINLRVYDVEGSTAQLSGLLPCPALGSRALDAEVLGASDAGKVRFD